MRLGLLLVATLSLNACAGVPPKAIRDWAGPNFKQYRGLVDAKYTDEMTRLNGYKSMASLICDADTADGTQGASKACKCQLATSDEDLKTNCQSFIQDYR